MKLFRPRLYEINSDNNYFFRMEQERKKQEAIERLRQQQEAIEREKEAQRKAMIEKRLVS